MNKLPDCPTCEEDELYMPFNMTMVRKTNITEVKCYVCNFEGEIDVANNEIWKTIPNYKDYKISNSGRVKSFKNYASMAERMLVNCIDSEGYPRVTLRENSIQKFCKIHRIITETFFGKCPEGMEVCHYDGNKENNNLSNLRYDTRIGNRRDDKRRGVYKGERAGNAKLKECEVLFIRYLWKNKIKRSLIAKMFKMSHSQIGGITNNKSWAHI